MGGECGRLPRAQRKNHHRVLQRPLPQPCGCESGDESVGVLQLTISISSHWHTPAQQECKMLTTDCRACRHDGIFYLDMTGEDARKPLDELHIAKYLNNSKYLHDLSDVEKLGFELDDILPLGTTG